MGEEASLSALCRKYGISRPTGPRASGTKAARRCSTGRTRRSGSLSKPVRMWSCGSWMLRAAHPTWGARKIQRFWWTRVKIPFRQPAPGTNILEKPWVISEGLFFSPWKRFARDRPNALWQMDYGPFGMTNGQRFRGLTIPGRSPRFSPVPRREGKTNDGRAQNPV